MDFEHEHEEINDLFINIVKISIQCILIDVMTYHKMSNDWSSDFVYEKSLADHVKHTMEKVDKEPEDVVNMLVTKYYARDIEHLAASELSDSTVTLLLIAADQMGKSLYDDWDKKETHSLIKRLLSDFPDVTDHPEFYNKLLGSQFDLGHLDGI